MPGLASDQKNNQEYLENFEQSSFLLYTNMAQENMEAALGFLRRPRGAPETNDISQKLQADMLKMRRNSTFTHQHYPLSSPSPIRTSLSRLHQIKQEETMGLMKRETMHEWETQTAIKMSQSWKENLKLSDDLEKPSSSSKSIDLIPVAPVISPRRTGKQYYSSSLQTCVSRMDLPPSPIPSSLQQFAIGSQSPTITVRPSILGSLKRKGEMAREDQSKRFFRSSANMFSPDTSQLSRKNV
ncbi:protein FAM122A-like isoform X2 [Tupaia chinensis]|nr:protein FAM122A-like isoform X2 [Tupaia chinensis]